MGVDIRLHLGDDVRRLAVDGPLDKAMLEQEVQRLYGLEAGSFRVEYTDEEGDRITLSGDDELSELLIASQVTKLHLYVVVKSAPSPSASASSASANPPGFPPGLPLARLMAIPAVQALMPSGLMVLANPSAAAVANFMNQAAAVLRDPQVQKQAADLLQAGISGVSGSGPSQQPPFNPLAALLSGFAGMQTPSQSVAAAPSIDLEAERISLEQLESMGFPDADRNRSVLRRHGGNLLATVEELAGEVD